MEGSRSHWALHMKPQATGSSEQHGTALGGRLCPGRPTAQGKVWTLTVCPFLIVITKLPPGA